MALSESQRTTIQAAIANVRHVLDSNVGFTDTLRLDAAHFGLSEIRKDDEAEAERRDNVAFH